MPRDASLSDSQCRLLQSGDVRVNHTRVINGGVGERRGGMKLGGREVRGMGREIWVSGGMGGKWE